MAKNYYMHMLDSYPASFYRGQGVLFGVPIVLATSLRQLRREQRESRAIFARKGVAETVKYGYRRVIVPTSTTDHKR